MEHDDLELRQEDGPAISAADLHAVLRLRSEVFVVEQACAYLDPDGRDLEAGTTHLWLQTSEGAVASYIRLLTEPDDAHRIGRVVTDPAFRGHGLAARLIDQALASLEGPVVLAAQSHLAFVYARHGFVPDGEPFVDDGIPHTPMRLER